MSDDQPEELKKLELKQKRHRCEWCDFISLIKDKRKFAEPLPKKTKQNDKRVEDNSCTESNSNVVRPNVSNDA